MEDSTKSHSRAQRLSQIDALRGIAALLVLSFHFTIRFWEQFGHKDAFFFNVSFGQYGVDLFFVISGFVIFLTLHRFDNTYAYIKNRFLRIFPLFCFAVLLEIIVQLYITPSDMSKGLSPLEMLANFTLIHQYFYIPSINGVYWTLVFELSFYFWILLCFKAVPKQRREMAVFLWVLLSVGVLSFNELLLGSDIPYRLQLVFMLNYSHLFAAGIVLYCSYRDRLTYQRTLMLMVFIAVHFYLHGWIAGVIAMLSVVALYLASRGHLRFLENRVALYLGSISYALYLVHQNIGHIVMKKVFDAGFGQVEAMLLAIAISIVLASLLTFYVERPFIKLLSKLRISTPHKFIAIPK